MKRSEELISSSRLPENRKIINLDLRRSISLDRARLSQEEKKASIEFPGIKDFIDTFSTNANIATHIVRYLYIYLLALREDAVSHELHPLITRIADSILEWLRKNDRPMRYLIKTNSALSKRIQHTTMNTTAYSPSNHIRMIHATDQFGVTIEMSVRSRVRNSAAAQRATSNISTGTFS